MNKEIFKKIEEANSYLLTLTTLNKESDKNNLNHFVDRKEFPISDIIPSLDSCTQSMNINLDKPANVIIPPKINGEIKPLKISFISHFRSCPASYSPARALRNQIKILREYGHDVTLFLNEKSKLDEKDFDCNLLKVIPNFKREKMVVNEEIKDKLISVFKEHLEGKFDVAITYDFFIQDTVTFSEAIRQCKVDIPWLHFARSGVAHDMDFSMPNAKFIYLNKADIGSFAKAIKVPTEQCRTVYNEKDPNYMFGFDPITKMIIDKYELWDRDIIQTYPVCSTRLSAKGLRHIIKLFVELKRLGKKVMLIIPNSNGKRRAEDLTREMDIAKEMGLNEDEFIFTSLLASEEYNTASELSNKVCAELMQISNLFAAPSAAEVGPNILLEAAMTKNLIIANSDLPLMYDFVDKEKCLSFPFTSDHSLHYKVGDQNAFINLAKNVIKEIDNNKADLAFRQVWKNHNKKTIYHQLMDVIVEVIEDNGGTKETTNNPIKKEYKGIFERFNNK